MRTQIKQGLKQLGAILVYIIVLGGVGFIGYRIGMESTPLTAEGNLDVGRLLIRIGIVMVIAGGLVYGHVIIHELGHLLAGKLSGYTFMLFRIGRFGLIKEDGQFKTISFTMSGTMGQCLMHPPENNDRRPYRFYLLGGVLANGITALIAGTFYLIYPSEYIMIFIVIGVMSATMNGIPLSFNDGKILRKLGRSSVAQDQFFQQLKWNGEFVRHNKTYSEAAEDQMTFNPNEPVTEQFNIYNKLIEINASLEQKNFKRAESNLSDLYDQRSEIIPPYRIEILREYVYCLLIEDSGTPELIERILSDKLLKSHLKMKQADVCRVNCVIAYFVDNDRNEAKRWYDLAREHLDKLPSYADKRVNTNLLDHLGTVMSFVTHNS